MVSKLNLGLTGNSCRLILFSIILISARCEDEKPFASQNLTLVLPISVQPANALISKGDTLWISANISDSLYEYHSKKKYKLANFNFGQTSLVIRKLVDINKLFGDQPGAGSAFIIFVEKGSITFQGDTFVDYNFFYNQITKSYQLKIALVPQEIGIFCIASLSPKDLNYQGILDLGRSNEGATIIPVYEDLFFPVNNGENNFDLFKQHCRDNSASVPNDYRGIYYIQKGSFTFEVK